MTDEESVELRLVEEKTERIHRVAAEEEQVQDRWLHQGEIEGRGGGG